MFGWLALPKFHFCAAWIPPQSGWLYSFKWKKGLSSPMTATTRSWGICRVTRCILNMTFHTLFAYILELRAGWLGAGLLLHLSYKTGPAWKRASSLIDQPASYWPALTVLRCCAWIHNSWIFINWKYFYLRELIKIFSALLCPSSQGWTMWRREEWATMVSCRRSAPDWV